MQLITTLTKMLASGGAAIGTDGVFRIYTTEQGSSANAPTVDIVGVHLGKHRDWCRNNRRCPAIHRLMINMIQRLLQLDK